MSVYHISSWQAKKASKLSEWDLGLALILSDLESGGGFTDLDSMVDRIQTARLTAKAFKEEHK